MKSSFQFIVVDDDPITNMLNKYIISSIAPDAQIYLFTDPEEALVLIAKLEGNPGSEAILFLDINMPVLNGWEFLDRMILLPGKFLSHMSIFMLSSSIDPKDTQNAKNHPLVKGYYSKPLTREILKKVINA